MEAPEENLIGTVIDRKLRILRHLGVGGMGAVYLAEHMSLGRKFAVKVLRHDLSERPEFAERFLREAQAASRIEHPNVIEVLDTGYLKNGAAYYVMEHLAGEDLSATLQNEGRLPWPRVRHMALQICEVLAAAHTLGIVHRDLKPANCFRITRRDDHDFIKVLDFGIAKLIGHNSETLTGTGELLGTALYMAPEQAQGARIDHRVDIYALGAVLYHLLTGRAPYPGRNNFEVLSALLLRTPQPFALVAPDADIPDEVEVIVRRALAKDPRDRYASMTALSRALVAVAAPTAPSTAPSLPSLPQVSAHTSSPMALNSTIAAQLPHERAPPQPETVDAGPVAPRQRFTELAPPQPEPSHPPVTVLAPPLPATPAPPVTPPLPSRTPTEAQTDVAAGDSPTDTTAVYPRKPTRTSAPGRARMGPWIVGLGVMIVAGLSTYMLMHAPAAPEPEPFVAELQPRRASPPEPAEPKPAEPKPAEPKSAELPPAGPIVAPVTPPDTPALTGPTSTKLKPTTRTPKTTPKSAPAVKTVKDVEATLRSAEAQVRANCHSEFLETVYVSLRVEAATGKLLRGKVLSPHDLSHFRGCIETILKKLSFPAHSGNDYVSERPFVVGP